MRCKSWPALIPGMAFGVDADHFVGSPLFRVREKRKGAKNFRTEGLSAASRNQSDW